MGPTKLKQVHMDNCLMYHVYWKQTAAAYSSLYFFIFVSLQFSYIYIFLHFSQELLGLQS